jgi:hypothetical protein
MAVTIWPALGVGEVVTVAAWTLLRGTASDPQRTQAAVVQTILLQRCAG